MNKQDPPIFITIVVNKEWGPNIDKKTVMMFLNIELFWNKSPSSQPQQWTSMACMVWRIYIIQKKPINSCLGEGGSDKTWNKKKSKINVLGQIKCHKENQWKNDLGQR